MDLRAHTARRQIVKGIEHAGGDRHQDGEAILSNESRDVDRVEDLDSLFLLEQLGVRDQKHAQVARHNREELHLGQKLLLEGKRRQAHKERHQHQEGDGHSLRQQGHCVYCAEEGKCRHHRSVNEHLVYERATRQRKRRVRVDAIFAESNAVDGSVEARADNQHEGLRKKYLVDLKVLLLECYLLADVHKALHSAIDDGSRKPKYDPLLPPFALICRAKECLAVIV